MILENAIKKYYFFIPESFNTNIYNQLFDYKITFVKSKHENVNSKVNFVLKARF